MSNDKKIVDISGNAIVSNDPKAGTMENDWNPYNPPAVFRVFGVQYWDNGVLVGTALYDKQWKAVRIKDIMNAEYAKLKVNQEAKIISYPVY